MQESTFHATALADWRALEAALVRTSATYSGSSTTQSQQAPPVSIDSHSLTISDIVAVSRHGRAVALADAAVQAMEATCDVISDKLADGAVIYGVNTGFGGSADTRTNKVVDLQQSLFSHLMCGTLASSSPSSNSAVVVKGASTSVTQDGRFQHALPLGDVESGTSMPEAWARAAMLVRLNSLAAGASGIRVGLATCLAQLLNKDVVPRIPLRGSVSASGDLSPLSYVGAVMQGKPSATAFAGSRRGKDGEWGKGTRKVLRADMALKQARIDPVEIRAKEGLAIVNGTAVSAGVAALAVHESMNLAALAQVLTAMSVEAHLGTRESFEPFIARVRPHPGQVDAARTIAACLGRSKLATRRGWGARLAEGELRQDRYSLRTASQWIGPVLEDFLLAREQVTTELNSVTDNPLIDGAAAGAGGAQIYHGGNFQAKAVTSAVEKLRQGLQSLGRLLFAQASELMNPATSGGLPPNLVRGDPSTSHLLQGLEISMAALTSELGFLANPVGSHVQTAEKGNQAVNSLALVSARYTLEAVDVLSQLSAAHLVATCQALDLRVRRELFMEAVRGPLEEATAAHFPGLEVLGPEALGTEALLAAFSRGLDAHAARDVRERLAGAVEEMQLALLQSGVLSGDTPIDEVRRWARRLLKKTLLPAWREDVDADATAARLGAAGRRVYEFVRRELGVPFLGEAHLQGGDFAPTEWHVDDWDKPLAPSVGLYQGRVYEAIRSGRLYAVVADCLEEVDAAAGGSVDDDDDETLREEERMGVLGARGSGGLLSGSLLSSLGMYIDDDEFGDEFV